ncbi:MAG: alpha/beta hydrolase [Actinomycetota bacterium]|nr:alpha/beta hydrolase [Actinomycetota bacterium]
MKGKDIVDRAVEPGTEHIQIEVSGPSRRTRVLRRAGLTAGVLLVLFYGVGGWYFSSELGSDAFVVSESSTEFDLEIIAIDGDEITLRTEVGSDEDLLREAVFGLALPTGRLTVGDPVDSRVEEGFDVATRQFQIVEGPTPSPGTPADLDSWFYETDPSDIDLAYDEIRYSSSVGELDAWFVPAESATWAIVIHGKGAQRREGLRILEAINEAGYPTLVITSRNDPGQPLDPSGYHRYGATEWADVEGAVRYAVDSGADDVVLVGLSTGAAHALSFVYQSEAKARVVGAIFDAPNIDFGRTVDFGASQRELPVIGVKLPQSLTTVAKFISSLRYDFDWSQHDFIDRIDEVDFPILVFHGTDDSTVPMDVSIRLHDERPDLVRLIEVEGAAHVQSWNADPAAYRANIVAFLDSIN